jgi:LacI family transcriptional regulator, galactose operon repressor
MAEASRSGRAARLADVARAAGVGTSIASRVLNGDPTVSIRLETRERILAAARELNYRPNAMARGLRLARTMSLGIIVNLAYYYENAEILAAVESAAASAGYVTLIADSADFVSRGEAYRRLLFERRVDGLLIASIFVSDEFVHELKDGSLPYVVVNRRVAGAGPSATVDDELGMSTAVEHLVRLGHGRIGYVAGPAHSDPAARRLAGFRAGMQAAGLRTPVRLVRQCPVDDESVLRATHELLETTPRPTAIAVWSPTAAVPALAAVRRLGIRIPEQLSVIAFNDSPIASYLEPPLTTVHMPLAEMARGAVDCLLQGIDGGAPKSFVVRTPPTLVERESTGPAPGAA